MKKITLTADEELIKRAQSKACADKTTLTAEFRHWLEEYVQYVELVEANPVVAKPAKPVAAVPKTQGSALTRCVDALKKFEKKLEEKL